MGKRTSDFMALAAILGGAGLGLGLTSLLAQSRADGVSHADDFSVSPGVPGKGSYIRIRGGKSLDVEILRRSIELVPGRIADSSEEPNSLTPAKASRRIQRSGDRTRVRPAAP